MKRPRDRRPAVLLGTLALVAAVALAVQSLPTGPGGEGDPSTPSAGGGRGDAVARSFHRGVQLLQSGRDAQALAEFERVLALAPGLPQAHVNRGFALLGLRDYAAAGEAFSAALALHPGQANAYWGLAVVREAACDRAGASAAMRAYLHLAPAGQRFARRAQAALWEWGAIAPDGGCSDGARAHPPTDRERG